MILLALTAVAAVAIGLVCSSPTRKRWVFGGAVTLASFAAAAALLVGATGTFASAILLVPLLLFGYGILFALAWAICTEEFTKGRTIGGFVAVLGVLTDIAIRIAISPNVSVAQIALMVIGYAVTICILYGTKRIDERIRHGI